MHSTYEEADILRTPQEKGTGNRLLPGLLEKILVIFLEALGERRHGAELRVQCTFRSYLDVGKE